MSGDVTVGVYCSTQLEPVINLSLLDCPGARVVDDKRGRFIEFAAANLFAGRFDNTAQRHTALRCRSTRLFRSLRTPTERLG